MRKSFSWQGLFRLGIQNIWLLTLIVVLSFLFYQLTFTWDANEESLGKGTTVDNDSVVLITISEKHFGDKKKSFDSLLNSLQTWAIDERKKEVSLKFEAQLPKTSTKAVIVYEKGSDSFERYSEVLNISTLPYHYYFNKQPLVTIHQIDSKGRVFLEYKGKRVRLTAGESYPEWSFEGYRMVSTTIQNRGLYKKDHFHPFKTNTPLNKDTPKDKKPAESTESRSKKYIHE